MAFAEGERLSGAGPRRLDEGARNEDGRPAGLREREKEEKGGTTIASMQKNSERFALRERQGSRRPSVEKFEGASVETKCLKGGRGKTRGALVPYEDMKERDFYEPLAEEEKAGCTANAAVRSIGKLGESLPFAGKKAC